MYYFRSRFRSIHSLKYQIQTGLDQLEASRKVLLDRLLEIDQTMEKPKEEDIERVGKCQNCQPDFDGAPCILCEFDELFQVCYWVCFLTWILTCPTHVICPHSWFNLQDYEARLFVLKNERGGIISSAEEAVDLQKKNFALNRFLSKLSQSNHSSTASDIGHEESKKRNVGERVVVSCFLIDLTYATSIYWIWQAFAFQKTMLVSPSLALGQGKMQIAYNSSLFFWVKTLIGYLTESRFVQQ